MFSNNPNFSLPKVACRRTSDDIPVQDGLALTPAKLGELTEKGIPISAPMGMQFFDGYKDNVDFDPGIVWHRGVDIIDAWNVQEDARMALRKAHKAKMAADAAAAAQEGGQ